MKIKLSQSRELLIAALQAKLVPMMHGSPAIGKSAVVHQVAEDFGLKMIDVRLSQCDPVDLMGFPKVDGKKATYLPMDTFPIEGDEIPEGYNGWLLFLDELTSAVPAVQVAAYKLMLDRMVGMHHLHSNVAVVAAGNLATDGAVVEEMSTALQSRLVHLEVEPNVKDWLDWASAQQFDHRILSFLEFRPDLFYTFKPDHTDKTYAAPRTWEFTNRLLKVIGDPDKKHLPLLAGTLGEGVAREFYAYCQIMDKVPKMEHILKAPQTTKVPEEPSYQYAVCGAIAAGMTMDNAEPLVDYLTRLPPEFQVMCVRSAKTRTPGILGNARVVQWLRSLSHELI